MAWVIPGGLKLREWAMHFWMANPLFVAQGQCISDAQAQQDEQQKHIEGR